jgi:cell division protein FtsW
MGTITKIKAHLKGDTIIWSLLVVLSILSLLAVYSSTGTLAYRYHSGNVGYYIIKHFIFLVFGFSIVYFAHIVPYQIYSRLSQLLLLISVPLLLFTLVFGSHINDASRWIAVPGTGMTFQTSDLAKLALIMYVARVLSLKQDNIKSFKETFLPIIIPVIVICGLIMPANLSTAVLLFGVSMILMFIGRINFTYIAILGLGIVAFLIIIIAIALKSNWEGRWETWKNRIVNHVEGKADNNYQADQSKIAIVTGGIFGKGPGNSTQRNFLPHPYSDFIFAIIIEEYGLVGGLFVVMIYLVLLFRAGMLVKASDRTFPAFLAIGLATLLVMQGMVNMAVAVGLFPVTGQPLPMISMGGTSILFTAAAFGIILSVSRGLQNEKTVVQNEKIEEEALVEA